MPIYLRVGFTLVISFVSLAYVTEVLRAAPVEYQLTVRNDWSQAHHKTGAPSFSSVDQPHFSHLGGGTHNSSLVVWQEGELSSYGMIKMQETGWIDEPANSSDLKDEFDGFLTDGTAGSFLNYPIPNPWFPAGTETVLNFEIEEAHPLVTLVSMLGPSPDWFIGVSGLNLREGNQWKELVEVDLYPYDGGSRSRDEQFSLFGTYENPQVPIQAITDTDDTLLLGSIPIGKFTFELLTPQSAAGDFDDDSSVDGEDFLMWQRGEVTAPPSETDLLEWNQNYGQAPAVAGQSAAVPEPAGCVLVFSWAFSVLLRRRSNSY
jgi:hypothetical protein